MSLKRCVEKAHFLEVVRDVLIQFQANIAMGIRSGASKDNMTLPMLSDDILKIEISGPDVRGLDRLNDSLE